jgi:hypothetical protein
MALSRLNEPSSSAQFSVSTSNVPAAFVMPSLMPRKPTPGSVRSRWNLWVVPPCDAGCA